MDVNADKWLIRASCIWMDKTYIWISAQQDKVTLYATQSYGW